MKLLILIINSLLNKLINTVNQMQKLQKKLQINYKLFKFQLHIIKLTTGKLHTIKN